MSVQEYSPDGTAGAATPADIVAAVERASTRRTTPNGAGEVVWHIWGKGDPLVLVHGGTGSWRHWIRNIEYLARDFQIITPDIPGSGDSSSPEPPITRGERRPPDHRGNQDHPRTGPRLRHRRFLDGRIGRELCRLPIRRAGRKPGPSFQLRHQSAPRRDGAAALLAAVADRSAKARGTPQESQHPDDPRPRQDRRARALCAGREFHALARARQARFDHRHARAKSSRLQRKTRRHLGRVRLHVGALYPRAQSAPAEVSAGIAVRNHSRFRTLGAIRGV